ncbi:unnamed protein product [Meganyctiphanes norvegica]|uniref:C-type lectin domain-containing protein n=1 Tax=Meganyctiphanes norvegica TaxID=48144 RepID=A0AAV2S3Y0_MEGNR
MLVLLFMALYLHSGETQTKECRGPFHPVGNQCLYFGDLILEDHENAKAVCQSLGGHLVRVTQPQQLKDIVDYIDGKDYGDGTSFWVDGTDINQEGQWEYSNGESVPMGTPFWEVRRSEDTYHQQPDNAYENENCLEMRKEFQYYFNDVPCNLTRLIICEDESQQADDKMDINLKKISCPALFVPVSGLCLAFLTFADQTWAEARQTCSSLGGGLAKLTLPQHLRDIYIYINQQGLSEDSFWIGGSDAETEGVWLFTDGSAVPSGTPFWGVGIVPVQEPDGDTLENCLLLNADGQYYFRDFDCNNLNNPLCLINPL